MIYLSFHFMLAQDASARNIMLVHWLHSWHPCPSDVPACAPCHPLCPSFRCPCPCMFSAPALPCCCLHWRPARAPAPSCRRERPGLFLVSVPLRCCPRLRPPLVPALLLRLLPSLGRLPPLAPRPVAGVPPRPIAVPPRLDHAPRQLRQCDAHRCALGRRGADGQRPPLGEVALWCVWFGGGHMGAA